MNKGMCQGNPLLEGESHHVGIMWGVLGVFCGARCSLFGAANACIECVTFNLLDQLTRGSDMVGSVGVARQFEGFQIYFGRGSL